jgi:putative SbcD/Mre11-related phosphoesterase
VAKIYFTSLSNFYSMTSSRISVAQHVVLDGRLALFHERDRWLAVADLHFGYELSQRAAGNLFPLWGMKTIEARLAELVNDYEPTHLILLGDLVHDQAAASQLLTLVNQLRARCAVILLAGNHDRKLGREIELTASWRSRGFCFHHGHCDAGDTSATAEEIQIIGHHHPAGVVRDGAGLRLKLPAFVQEEKCWIMPAFSPWAAGTEWPQSPSTRMWLCSPQRVLELPAVES